MRTRWIYYIFPAMLVTGCAAANKTPVSAPVADDATPVEDASLNSLLVPENAARTPGGYRYVTLAPGNGTKPERTDAVRVDIHIVDLEGNTVDERQAVMSMSQATPFLEEIFSRMEIGQRVRVWGESKSRIWEIELLSIDDSFKAPDDVAEPPADAHVLEGAEGIDGVRWRVITPGNGETLRDGQALRFQAARWRSNGEILESNRMTQGQFVFLHQDSSQLDAIHRALLYRLCDGEHIRMWIPGTYVADGHDIVEDLWIVGRIPALDTPEALAVPETEVLEIEPGKAFMRFLSDPRPDRLVRDDVVRVRLTCWNGTTGMLVDSTLFRDHEDTMELDESLGIWLKIMLKAAPGDVFMTWIKAEALPEQVGSDLTCSVSVLEKL